MRVTELIAAAQRHLDEFGDSVVGVVTSKTEIERVVRTGYDTYDGEEGRVFELECEGEGES